MKNKFFTLLLLLLSSYSLIALFSDPGEPSEPMDTIDCKSIKMAEELLLLASGSPIAAICIKFTGTSDGKVIEANETIAKQSTVLSAFLERWNKNDIAEWNLSNMPFPIHSDVMQDLLGAVCCSQDLECWLNCCSLSREQLTIIMQLIDFFDFEELKQELQKLIFTYINTPELLHVLQLSHEQQPRYDKHVWKHATSIEARMAFSHDDSRIVIPSGENAEVWNVISGHHERMLAHDGDVLSAIFSPDDTQIATGSFDRTAKLWDTASGECRHVLQHEGPVQIAKFTSDSTQVLTGWLTSPSATAPQIVSIWNAQNGQRLRMLSPATTEIWGIAPYRVAWDDLDEDRMDYIPLKSTPTIRPLEASFLLATLAHDETMAKKDLPYHETKRDWDTSTGRRLIELKAQGMQPIALSHNQQRLLTRAGRTRIGLAKAIREDCNPIELWDSTSMQPLYKLPGSSGDQCARFSPDDAVIATSAGKIEEEDHINIYDTYTGQSLYRVTRPPRFKHYRRQPWFAPTFDHESTIIATASKGQAYIWMLAPKLPQDLDQRALILTAIQARQDSLNLDDPQQTDVRAIFKHSDSHLQKYLIAAKFVSITPELTTDEQPPVAKKGRLADSDGITSAGVKRKRR